MINITIPGRVPSKKNSRQNIQIKGRLISIPGKAYRDWHKEVMKELSSYTGEKYIDHAEISLTLFQPDKRKRDLTNQAESIMDLLVDYNILIDDNCFIIPRLEIVFGGIDKDYPRAEVRIDKISTGKQNESH